MTPQEKARQLRPLIVKASASLSDEDALTAKEFYSKWEPGMECVADTRYFYNDELYRCNQTHTSQSDWTPDVTPALFTKVSLPGEIDVWKRPTGAHDAYDYGAKVYYPTKDDDIYMSIYDGKNSWSPDEYPQGWEKVS